MKQSNLDDIYERLENGSKLNGDDIKLLVDSSKDEDIDISSKSWEILSTQLVNDLYHIPTAEAIIKCLQNQNLLNLKVNQFNNDQYLQLHNNITSSLSLLQEHHANLLMPIFKLIVLYLSDLLASNSPQLRLCAVNFFRQLRNPPIQLDFFPQWSSCILGVLDKVIPSLIGNCITYTDELIEYSLQEKSPMLDVQPPKRILDLSNLRNWAALSLENLSVLLITDVCLIAKPLILGSLSTKQNSWRLKEAYLLASAAIFQSVQGKQQQQQPRIMGEVYEAVLQTCCNCLEDKESLLKAISCFVIETLLHTGSRRLKEECWNKFINSLHSLMSDDCREVRESCLRALTSILAHGQFDIEKNSKKIYDALKSNESRFDGSSKPVYYECCVHLLARNGCNFPDKGVSLLEPLIRFLENCMRDDENSIKDEDDKIIEEFLLNVQSLCLCAVFCRQAFENYQDSLLNKIEKYFDSCILNHEDNHNDNNEDDGGGGGDGFTKVENKANKCIALIDLSSSIYEGSKTALSNSISARLATHALKFLNRHENPSKILQSSLALLGNLAKKNYLSLRLYEKDLISILERYVGHSDPDIKSNAIWCMACVFQNTITSFTIRNESEFMNVIIQQFTKNYHTTSLILLLSICELCPKMADCRSTLTSDEIFPKVCRTLQIDWPKVSDRRKCMEKLCRILNGGKCFKKVNKEWWVDFLGAAFFYDAKNNNDFVRQTLHDLRGVLGANYWSRIMQEMGTKTAASLRKKYQLY